MPPKTDMIYNSFPNLTLLYIPGEATLNIIITNHCIQCKNVVSLTYFGEYGTLAAIITSAQYHAFTGASLLLPADPGHTFMTLPDKGTLQQTFILLEAFKTNKKCCIESMP